MDSVTKAMAEFIEEKGFQLSAISIGTNIPYSALWSSLSKSGTRSLRADEFLSVCKFIEKPAFDFYRLDNEPGIKQSESA